MRNQFLRTVQKTPTDPFFDQTTLLLHGDGTNGAQNNTFVSTPSSPYSYFVNFSGTGQYLSIPSSTAFDFGSGDFTIEGWIRKPNSTSGAVVSRRGTNNNATWLVWSPGTTLEFYGDNNALVSSNSKNISDNVWHHFAAVRSGGNTTLYVDGIAGTTDTSAYTYPTGNGTVWIANDQENPGGRDLEASISNVRIVKGTAVYTANFVPPTAPLTAITNTSLLTCQSPTIVDNSSNGFAITQVGTPTVTSTISPTGGISGNPVNWYGTFNGSNQYLTTANNAAFDLGTGDCTIEAWIYTNSLSAGQAIFSAFPASGTISGYTFVIDTSGFILIDSWVSGTEQFIVANNNAIVVNTWNHVAYTRSGGTNRLFVNGNLCTTSLNTLTQNLNTGGNTVKVGYQGYAGFLYPFNGRLSNVRVVKGTALYTAAFTPPQGTLPEVTNTSLLTLQSGAIVDSSSNIFPITNNGSVNMTPGYWQLTRNGNTTQGSFSPFSNAAGAWSNYFDGTGDRLTAPFTAGNFDFGTGDFTVEMWIYPTKAFVNGAYALLWQNFNSGGSSNNRVAFGFGSSQLGLFYDSTGLYAAAGTVSVNTWTHVALTRASNTVRIFANGTQIVTGTVATNFNAGQSCIIGGDSTDTFTGYISNLRVVKGTAVYTAAFTPPTSPLTAITNTTLLTCQSNRFVDNSANNLTITRNGDVTVRPFGPFNPTSAYSTTTVGGSGYFDGTGDYLSSATNSGFAVGTGDFTVEFFVYCTGSDDFYGICDTRANSGSAGFWISNNTAASRGFRYGTTGTVLLTVGGQVQNTWQHVAVVRNSGTVNIYVNGVSQGSVTDTRNYTDTNCNIGAYTGGATPAYFGYISNFRFIKGTAVYTSNFTPPTAPLTAITNTSLLLNFTNAGIFDNTARNDLETVGNAQISTSVKKYGTGSLAFDGTGDGLLLPASPELAFGLGNFTIECWIYLPSTQTSTAVLFDSRIDNPSVTGSSIEWSYRWSAGDNAYVSWLTTPSNNMIITFSAVLSRDTWHFVTLVRSAGTFIIFHNGSSVGSYGPVSYDLLAGRTRIGYGDAGTMNGYIDDYRITKGVARYTGTFTPPTAAFPDL